MATKTRINDIKIPTKVLEVGDKFYFNRKLHQKTKTESPLYEITSISSLGNISLKWDDKNSKGHQLQDWLQVVEAQKFVQDGTITFPKPTKSGQVRMTRGKSVTPPIELKTEMFLANNKGELERIIDINLSNDVKTQKYGGLSKVVYNVYKTKDVEENISSGYYKLFDISVGDSFLDKNDNSVLQVVKVDTNHPLRIDYRVSADILNPSMNSVTGNIENYTLPRFGDLVILNGFTYLGNAMTSAITPKTTPLQVGDEFIMLDNPPYPTNDEKDDFRIVTNVDFTNEDIDYIFNNSKGLKLTLPFSDVRKLLDEGRMIVTKRANPIVGSVTSIKPLQRFDLFERESDLKLYYLNGTDSGSFDVDDDELIDLKFYSANRIEVLNIPYNQMLENINKGEIKFLGQVRVGDAFVGQYNLKYVVSEVLPSSIRYESLDVSTSKSYGYNTLPTEAFVDMLLTNNCIMVNRQSQTPTPQATIKFDPYLLKKYDLFKYYGKQLFFVDEINLNLDNIVLKSADNSGINDFHTHTFTIKDLKDVVDSGTLEYIGEVTEGDEFLDKDKKFSKLVTLVTIHVGNYDDIMFDNIDIDNALVSSQDVLTKPTFVKSIVRGEYTLQRRGNINNPQGVTNTPQKLSAMDLNLWDMVFNKNTNTLFILNKVLALANGDVDLTFEYNGRRLIGTSDSMTLTLSFVNKKIEEGELVYYGQVKVGDEFSYKDGSRKWVVEYVKNKEVFYNNVDISDPNDSQKDGEKLGDFFKYVVEYAMDLKRNVANPTTTNNVVNVTPKPIINDAEIDALKKDLSDLLFLKSGISDLEFEEKINISTEIFETQRKIDNLTEKLFEQRVGDENFFDRLFDQSFTPLRDRYDMVIKVNDIPEIISPSGEMSDLEEEMQLLINSNDFKEWFGDWRNAYFYRNLPDFGGLNVSKVLSDKFEPQIVWHGTNNEFSYFDFEMFPANYFAVNKEYSEFFATNKGGRGYVLPFFLNIKNPLDLTYFGNDYVETKDFFDWMYLMTGMSAEELEVNPMYLDPNYPKSPIWGYIRNNPTMLQKISQGKVYDGIKFYEFNPNEENNPDKKAYETLAYIIFDPHQAKLADPNRGDILLASLKSFMLKRGGKI